MPDDPYYPKYNQAALTAEAAGDDSLNISTLHLSCPGRTVFFSEVLFVVIFLVVFTNFSYSFASQFVVVLFLII